jgi:hypothetical protein
MKITRRSGFFLSLLLVPALVLNPAPAHARVIDPGSPVTSWGTNGLVEHWKTTTEKFFSMTYLDAFEDVSGRYVFAASEESPSVSGSGEISVRSINKIDGSKEIIWDLTEAEEIAFGRDYMNVLDFDIDGKGRYLVLTEEKTDGPSIIRISEDGSLDSSFDGDGHFAFEVAIKALIEPELPLSGECGARVNVNDLVADFDTGSPSTYLLGSVVALHNDDIPVVDRSAECNAFATKYDGKLRLWRITESGLIDAGFGNDDVSSFQFVGANGVVPNADSAKMEMRDAENLTVVSRASVNGNEGIFAQHVDVDEATPFLDSPASYLENDSSGVIDFAFQPDLDLAILAKNCDESCIETSVFVLSNDGNTWNEIDSSKDMFLWSVATGPDGSIYVSAETKAGFKDSLIKYSETGLKISNFIGPQGSYGNTDSIDYYKGALFVDATKVTVLGVAEESPGFAISRLFYGAQYYVDSVTIQDQPAPAPAPVIAPALPTQTAPVAVPAVMKVKKKLKFPITSQAGNPLKVTASGACKVSPVFKKVKVKVGKKTKKVKKQTGWTVQMKKKKKTCTITQSDAGGNGYAALSSTVTVTIK